MKLISIGFGNAVAAARILAVVSPDSAPIKRVVQEARERGMLLDASFGRRTKSVLLMDTDHVILSSVTPAWSTASFCPCSPIWTPVTKFWSPIPVI